MGGERIGLQAIFGTEEFERGITRYVNSLADAVNRTRQAQTGFEQAGATMAGPLSAGAMAAAVAIGTILARAFEKVVEWAGQAARALWEYAKETMGTVGRVQELNVVMETIGRNAGMNVNELHGLVQQIKRLGITTEVAQGLVIQFSRWQLNMAQATDLARLAQDAAVISMQDSSEALDGLMHGIVTMNTRVLRTYGITLPSVVKAQEKYARSLGMTRDQLDETQMIQAVLNEVLEQGVQIAGAYEAAMEAPGKRLRSMARYTTELAEAMGTPFLGAFGSVVDIMTTFVQRLTDAFEAGGALRGMLEALADVAENILGAALRDLQDVFDILFGPAPERLVPVEPEVEVQPQPAWTPGYLRPRETVLGHVREPWEMPRGVIAGELAEEMRFVGRTMPEVGILERPMQRLMEALQGLRDSAMSFFEALGLGKPDAEGIAEAIADLVRGATGFVKAISGVVDWLRQKLPEAAAAAAPIVERIRGAFQTVADWWDENGPRVIQTASGLFERLGQVFRDLAEDVGPFIADVLDKISAWWDEHGPTVTEAMLRMQEGAANVFGWLAEQLPPIWEIVKPILMGLVDLFLGIVGAVASLVTGDWEGLWATIQQTAQAVWDRIKEAVIAFFDWITGWFGMTASDLQAQFRENWEMFWIIAAAVWERIEDTVREKIGEVLTAISGKVGDFVQAGRDIISGMIEGIRQYARRLVEAATGAIGDAIGAARRLLGLDSPSKLFMEYGLQTMMGYAEGILAGAGMTERAMKTAMAQAARPGAMAPAQSGSALTGGAGDSYNYTYDQRRVDIGQLGADLTNPFLVKRLLDQWLTGG